MSRHRCAVALRRDASRGGEDFRDRDDRRRVVAANRSKPDKTGDKRFYDRMIPIADDLYDEHLAELEKEKHNER